MGAVNNVYEGTVVRMSTCGGREVVVVVVVGKERLAFDDFS